jgi:predicted phosphodiesterase
MKQFLKFFILLLPLFSFSQENASFSVYLAGDAGEDTVSGKALLLLKDELLRDPASAVVFLGDNVYPSGFSFNNAASTLHLESQLNILRSYRGQAYFIPGNHDWDAQRRNGLRKIGEQQVFVNDFMEKNSLASNAGSGCFFPAGGLPGPSSVMLNEKLRLIMIDTQWFLQLYKKNKTGTKKQTRELFYQRLDSLLQYSAANGQQVIVTAHHPMFTNGEHSRKLQPLRFLVNYTPLKIFGFLGLNRLLSQDLSQPRYRKMRKRMLASFNKYDNIVYASGHDHNVQYFREGKINYVVSGNGSKLTKLKKKKRFDPLFEDDSKTGFVKLQYGADRQVKIMVYRVGEDVKVLNGK